MKSPETDPHSEPSLGNLKADSQADDSWFRAKVQEALDDQRPARSHDEVTGHFVKRRAAALDARVPAAAGHPEVDLEGQVKLGSLLAAVGRRAGLSDEEFAALQEMRETTPARPVR